MNRSINYVFLTLSLLLAYACSDPYKLSDKAEVTSASISAVTPTNVTFGTPEIKETNVVLPLTGGKNSFPADVTMSFITGGKEQKILNLDVSKPIRFSSPSDTKEFYVTSESGLPTKYQILIAKLPTPNDNDVEYFSVGSNIEPEEAKLVDLGLIDADATKGIITVRVENGLFPLSFTPTIRVSLNAQCSLAPNSKLTFDNMRDEVHFEVISESGIKKPWVVVLDANRDQLTNAKLDQWSDGYTPIGWATANNFMVKGTEKFDDPEKGVVAKLATSKVDLVTQIAAGSLFLGYFKLDLNAMNNPPLMTYQGIKFSGKPIRLQVDLKYTPGAKLEKSENGQYMPLEGVDEGRVVFELLRYDGPENKFEYHGFDNTAGVERIARKIVNVGGTNNKWIRQTVDLEFFNVTTQPNYVNVMFSSGARGDFFIGAEGSTLLVSNIELIYPNN